MDSTDWVIEAFTAEHNCEDFDCGEPSLNNYLTQHALLNAQRNLGQTYVALVPDDLEVWGYYTISAGSVVRDSMPKKEKRGISCESIPALHLGRLAVDRRQQGKGLGEYLLMQALALSDRLAGKAGIRLVEVKALNSKARQFYIKYGFVPLADEKSHLYLPMKTIRKLRLN